jgi:hypothetical protein
MFYGNAIGIVTAHRSVVFKDAGLDIGRGVGAEGTPPGKPFEDEDSAFRPKLMEGNGLAGTVIRKFEILDGVPDGVGLRIEGRCQYEQADEG